MYQVRSASCSGKGDISAPNDAAHAASYRQTAPRRVFLCEINQAAQIRTHLIVKKNYSASCWSSGGVAGRALFCCVVTSSVSLSPPSFNLAADTAAAMGDVCY